MCSSDLRVPNGLRSVVIAIVLPDAVVLAGVLAGRVLSEGASLRSVGVMKALLIGGGVAPAIAVAGRGVAVLVGTDEASGAVLSSVSLGVAVSLGLGEVLLDVAGVTFSGLVVGATMVVVGEDVVSVLLGDDWVCCSVSCSTC